MCFVIVSLDDLVWVKPEFVHPLIHWNDDFDAAGPSLRTPDCDTYNGWPLASSNSCQQYGRRSGQQPGARHSTGTALESRNEQTPYDFMDPGQSIILVTHNHIVVAAVAAAALRARPVLVPDVRAVRHVLAARPLAKRLRGALLRHVVLLEGALRKVRLAAPADARHAHVLAHLARLDRVQALLLVVRLVGAHVALEAVT